MILKDRVYQLQKEAEDKQKEEKPERNKKIVNLAKLACADVVSETEKTIKVGKYDREKCEEREEKVVLGIKTIGKSKTVYYHYVRLHLYCSRYNLVFPDLPEKVTSLSWCFSTYEDIDIFVSAFCQEANKEGFECITYTDLDNDTSIECTLKWEVAPW